MIDAEEYAQAQSQITLLSIMVSQLPLDEMLEQISLTEARAPFLDPTLWIKGADKLAEVKALVRAAIPLKREVLRQIKAEGAARALDRGAGR